MSIHRICSLHRIHTHTHSSPWAYAYVYAYTHTHTHTHTHIHKHTRMHTHTNTHTHTHRRAVDTSAPKFLYICWVGEGVPATIKAKANSHSPIISREVMCASPHTDATRTHTHTHTHTHTALLSFVDRQCLSVYVSVCIGIA